MRIKVSVGVRFFPYLSFPFCSFSLKKHAGIVQFVKATELVGARDSDVFLRRSLLGYQRFMFLLAKWPQYVDRLAIYIYVNI